MSEYLLKFQPLNLKNILVRINMNVCQVGNILYLDIKYSLKKDTTETHILVKFDKFSTNILWVITQNVFLQNWPLM